MGRYTAEIDAMVALFNRPFMASRAGHGSPSARPVFIVGMPRSGTSLTEQILSEFVATSPGRANSTLTCNTHYNKLLYSLGVRELFPDQVRALTPAKAEAYAAEYLAKIDFFSSTAARVTDKMPHNFHLVGLIALLFPKARVIFCRRDPLDNCFSIYSNSPGNEFHNYGADLTTLGAYYRQHIRLMEHWKSLLPDQVFELQYEQLVEDLEGVSRRMVDFIGPFWDSAFLACSSLRPIAPSPLFPNGRCGSRSTGPPLPAGSRMKVTSGRCLEL